jgi:hypothetical protein
MAALEAAIQQRGAALNSWMAGVGSSSVPTPGHDDVGSAALT